jgi:hypothetical protein
MKNTEDMEEDVDSKEAAQEAAEAAPEVEEEKPVTPAAKKKTSRSVVKVLLKISEAISLFQVF